MGDMRQRLVRVVWSFLLVAAACLAPGTALATGCDPTLPSEGSVGVPCYVKVQPIDVCPGTDLTQCAPFNNAGPQQGLPNGGTFTPPGGTPVTLLAAGAPLQPPPPPPGTTGFVPPDSTFPAQIPNNSLSLNPIGFVVDPSTGAIPGQPGYTTPGMDVTRTLLNNLGVELVWFPMHVLNGSSAPSNLNVTVQAGTTQAASCNGFIALTTLTITSCTSTSAPLAVYDVLTGSGIAGVSTTNPSGTFISALLNGSGGTGTYQVNVSQTIGSSKKPVPIMVFPGTLTSMDFQTLSDQVPPMPPNTTPCAISQMTIPPVPPCGPPPSPLSADPGTVNLFFVNNLTPPTPGQLYGFSWIGNNGVAISGQTFVVAAPLTARPDTIAHELGHNLGLDHTTFGAGPYNPQSASNPFPPGGITPFSTTLNPTPFVGECDPLYPGCAANLMTTGSLRTTTTPGCVLAPSSLSGCASTSFVQGTVDQATTASTPDGTTTLPISQQREALNGVSGTGGSGLLYTNSPQLQFSGLLNPIPRETTTAQLGTGDSATDRAIFVLSSPIDGRPGETLVGWILTLPQEQTFARHDGFHIISQSRPDLVQDVNYYPNPVNNPLRRNIAYQPGGDNNADNPSPETAGPSPCAFATAECLVVKFQPPGLGEHDSISFSKSILSGDAPITSDELCKAKITYIFSDGFVTTSNFGRCPPASLPLVASSWHPDPYVAPHFVNSDLLLANGFNRGCTEDPDNPGNCKALGQVADVDVHFEGGQKLVTCDGVTPNKSSIVGTLSAPVVIPGPVLNVIDQHCDYINVEFLGSLNIDRGQVYCQNCQVDGNVTMASGTFHLVGSLSTSSFSVVGNVDIANAVSTNTNAFSIGPDATIQGNLTFQSLPANEGGTVCKSAISGGLTLLNNDHSSIDIGQAHGGPTCPGNTIAGGISCKNPGNVTGGGNMLASGQVSPSCSFLIGP